MLRAMFTCVKYCIIIVCILIVFIDAVEETISSPSGSPTSAPTSAPTMKGVDINGIFIYIQINKCTNFFLCFHRCKVPANNCSLQ